MMMITHRYYPVTVGPSQAYLRRMRDERLRRERFLFGGDHAGISGMAGGAGGGIAMRRKDCGL